MKIYDKIAAGERLKQFRASQKLTQIIIAERLGIPQTTYSKYELGKLEIAMDILSSIHNTYCINLNWLITGEGEMFQRGEKKIIHGDNNSINIQTDIHGDRNHAGNALGSEDYAHIIQQQNIKIAYLEGQVALLKELLIKKA